MSETDQIVVYRDFWDRSTPVETNFVKSKQFSWLNENGIAVKVIIEPRYYDDLEDALFVAHLTAPQMTDFYLRFT
jgi:hypothetical protein